jgi:hypothetical protein
MAPTEGRGPADRELLGGWSHVPQRHPCNVRSLVTTTASALMDETVLASMSSGGVSAYLRGPASQALAQLQHNG